MVTTKIKLFLIWKESWLAAGVHNAERVKITWEVFRKLDDAWSLVGTGIDVWLVPQTVMPNVSSYIHVYDRGPNERLVLSKFFNNMVPPNKVFCKDHHFNCNFFLITVFYNQICVGYKLGLWVKSELMLSFISVKWNPSIPIMIDTLRPRQNGRHFTDYFFNCIFLNENVWVSIKISLKCVPESTVYKKSSLVQVMTWRRTGAKPFPEQGWPVHRGICESPGLNVWDNLKLNWRYK